MKTAFSYHLGLKDYGTTWEVQQTLFDSLIHAKLSGEKWHLDKVVEHHHTLQEAFSNHATLPTLNPSCTSSGAEGARPKETVENQSMLATGQENQSLMTEAPQRSRAEECTLGTSCGTEKDTNESEENTQNPIGIVLTVEHPPVYTLGKHGKAENMLLRQNLLEKMGAKFFHIDRGGDITFHGPGQLVVYPIVDLERIGFGLRRYIEALEEAVIRTVAEYGIHAGRIEGASGVWLGGETHYSEGKEEAQQGEAGGQERREAEEQEAEGWKAEGLQEKEGQTVNFEPKTNVHKGMARKICAIGVRSSRFVTMHGFALNVNTDLEWFSHINPCGFTDKGVTSIQREVGHTVDMNQVKEQVLNHLSEILNVRIYKY